MAGYIVFDSWPSKIISKRPAHCSWLWRKCYAVGRAESFASLRTAFVANVVCWLLFLF